MAANARGLVPGLAHAWATLRQDWLILLVLSGACVFSLCALVWLWGDLRGRVAAPAMRWLWFIGALVLGSPALLAYLARRPAAGART